MLAIRVIMWAIDNGEPLFWNRDGCRDIKKIVRRFFVGTQTHCYIEVRE